MDSRLIDKHIGSRIRVQRTLLGMTQEHLAAKLRLSYQQVQKYETGSNRVSASRLFEIGRTLEVDISYFFGGLNGDAAVQEPAQSGRSRLALDLVRNFLEIANEEQRAALASLVRTLKPSTDDTGSSSTSLLFQK